MRVVMVSCLKYKDAWPAFNVMFQTFWPDQRYTVISDWEAPGTPWCHVVADYAQFTAEPVLLMQEDFLLNAPVNTELVDHACEILERGNVGGVRLYPCPGATEPSDDPYFGRVARYTAYRTSCQATIWNPAYLREIAVRCNTPSDFEIRGSAWASSHLPAEMWAFKRDVQPWPMSYLCSAIARGKWTRDAVDLCRRHGLELDLDKRGVA